MAVGVRMFFQECFIPVQQIDIKITYQVKFLSIINITFLMNYPDNL